MNRCCFQGHVHLLLVDSWRSLRNFPSRLLLLLFTMLVAVPRPHLVEPILRNMGPWLSTSSACAGRISARLGTIVLSPRRSHGIHIISRLLSAIKAAQNGKLRLGILATLTTIHLKRSCVVSWYRHLLAQCKRNPAYLTLRLLTRRT